MMQKLEIKADRLKENIKDLDKKVIELEEKSEKFDGEKKEKYNNEIARLQKEITEKKEKLEKIKSKLKSGGVGIFYKVPKK
jgi:hypothetical protein